MVCGKPLMYFPEEQECQCAYCHKTFSGNSLCENGHFVCDACHAKEGLEIIEHICTETEETDMIHLFEQIRYAAIPERPEIYALFRSYPGNLS
jgi:hypothetical protein